jgi:hypothetical protein
MDVSVTYKSQLLMLERPSGTENNSSDSVADPATRVSLLRKVPGSKRSNYVEVDLLMAVAHDQVRDAILTLRGLILGCDVQCRVAVLMHGALRREFVELDEFLSSSEVLILGRDDRVKKRCEFVWRAKHEAQRQTFHSQMKALASMKSNKLAVVAWPSIVVDDPRWFGKMQRPFTLDPQTMVVIAHCFDNSNNPPAKPKPKYPFVGPLIMGSVDFPAILNGCVSGETDMGKDIRDVVRRLGGQRWILSSVRFSFLQVCPES